MSAEKSCKSCCHNMCKCPEPVPTDLWCHNHLMTAAQQYAEELLDSLKYEHALRLRTKIEHNEKTCLTCKLIAKAEGRE